MKEIMIKYLFNRDEFRNIVKNVIEHSCFIGLDSEGVAQFDYLKPKPTPWPLTMLQRNVKMEQMLGFVFQTLMGFGLIKRKYYYTWER